ncbi:aminopeptidase P N-terminal domain-containing protein [bacterium]|nr:aminopeptidase P N-terminal domain-containing protein [bacterium]MBU1675476.1 aminopeptidase P N-terminal domain-containing protein [bacterium]
MNALTYQQRRRVLRQSVGGGAILLPGNTDASRNYAANVYPFRQDSSFLYYAGIDHPGLVLLILPDGEEILYGPPAQPDDVIWSGPRPGRGDFAVDAGIDRHEARDELAGELAGLAGRGVAIHYLPPYRASGRLQLAASLGAGPDAAADGFSAELVGAVVVQREIKTDEEIAEIELAIAVSAMMYRIALHNARPGLREAQIAGAMQGVALAHDMQPSFLPIVTVRGEVLHNETYRNKLREGQLLLVDSGVETALRYCSDITRTLPVGGVFSPRQREIYEVVLSAQQAAIETAGPAATNRDVHLAAARAVAAGLIAVGLMKGDAEEAVAAGAHALFFPHGIGHMLGLDVHDMENLGDAVGYAPGEARSDQFGLNYLRLAKGLRPGFVITLEPGVYFIPALIDRWSADGRHADFIDHAAVRKYRDFGGIRIEDDVLVTEEGCRVLGPPIPKTVEDVELAMAWTGNVQHDGSQGE